MSNGKIVFCNLGQSFDTDAIRDEYYHVITDYLKEQDFDVEMVNGNEYDEDLTIQQLQDAHGVIFSSNGRMTRRVIEALPKLKLIMRYGIGLDSIDLTAASDNGKIVCYIPGYCSEMIGIHAISLGLASLRNIPYYNKYTRNGKWLKGNGPLPSAPRNLTIGIFGLGASARMIAQVFGQGFKSRLLATDPYAAPERAESQGVTLVDFEQLLAESDMLFITAPLTAETRHIFSDQAFEKMKNTAILINISRGPIVDLKALDRALKTGQIGKAALDVFEKEPPDPADPIFENEHLIATPHSAYYGRESLDNADYLVSRITTSCLRDKKLYRRQLANADVFSKLSGEGYTLSDEILLEV